MFVSKKHLPRRTVLRGIGGTVIALPFLDAMVPALTAQAQTAAARPLRFGAVYWPHGTLPVNWAPKATTPDFEFPGVLKPLEPFRDQLTVVSGLSNPQPGGHTTASSMYLNNSRPKRTQGQDVSADVTVDQLIADKIAGDTMFRSLELGTEDMSGSLGICGGLSCLYLSVLSWKSKTTPLPMDINPRVVFERMFGQAGSPAQRAARIRDERSMLDSISAEARQLQRGLGTRDRQRVGEYLDNLREIERRIQRTESRNATNVTLDTPVGVPDVFEDHVNLMYDLLAVAYQADVTRVFTFMLSRELSQRTYPNIGVTEQHHTVSHHGNDAQKIAQNVKVNTYHMGLFARFLDKLKSLPDGDGSVLDHSLIVYGGGMGNPNGHASDPLPCIGVGGGVGKGNRHVQLKKQTPVGNLWLAIANQYGSKLETFGDSDGRVEDFFG